MRVQALFFTQRRGGVLNWGQTGVRCNRQTKPSVLPPSQYWPNHEKGGVEKKKKEREEEKKKYCDPKRKV